MQIYSELAIKVVIYENGPGMTLLNVHDNENTATKAARKFINANGGTLIGFQNSEKRRITFTLGSRKNYSIDPNRMFTHAGIMADLSPSKNPEAIAAIKVFAQEFITNFNLDNPSDNLMIAIHNNADDDAVGKKSYLVSSYLDHQIHAEEREDIYINPNSNLDNFFITNDPAIFESLKEKKLNVVLHKAVDDGSLAYYSKQRGIRYVNIETQHRHQTTQIEMISALYGIIKTPFTHKK